MTFLDILIYLKSIPSKDLPMLLEELEHGIIFLANQWLLPTALPFVVALILSLALGVLAYRIFKPTMLVVSALFGYLLGAAAFYKLWETLPDLPAWVCYLFCFVGATLFVCLANINRALPALVVHMALGAYFAVTFYYPSPVIGLFAALLAAMLTILIPRVLYITVSSLFCGTLAVSFAAPLLPKVALLQIDKHWIAWVIALGVALVLAIVQFFLCKKRYTRDAYGF